MRHIEDVLRQLLELGYVDSEEEATAAWLFWHNDEASTPEAADLVAAISDQQFEKDGQGPYVFEGWLNDMPPVKPGCRWVCVYSGSLFCDNWEEKPRYVMVKNQS